ncbi:MAG: hypothetical protein AB2993_06250 [Candidatus Symbiodolus clandestinus]
MRVIELSADKVREKLKPWNGSPRLLGIGLLQRSEVWWIEFDPAMVY